MGFLTVDSDSPNVRFPPPLVYLGFLLIGRVINDTMGLNPAIPDAVRWIAGGGFIVLGIAIVGAALTRFQKAGTAPEPWKTSSHFVAEGIYRRTRNPMYLAMAIASLGISIAANCLGGILTLPLSIAAIQYWVIRPEEAYLSGKFGETYEAYRKRVRRWI